jgi:hypothetical protein
LRQTACSSRELSFGPSTQNERRASATLHGPDAPRAVLRARAKRRCATARQRCTLQPPLRGPRHHPRSQAEQSCVVRQGSRARSTHTEACFSSPCKERLVSSRLVSSRLVEAPSEKLSLLNWPGVATSIASLRSKSEMQPCSRFRETAICNAAFEALTRHMGKLTLPLQGRLRGFVVWCLAH